MKIKHLKIFSLFLTLFIGTLFFNIDNAKADSTQGEAYCVYYLNSGNASSANYEKKEVVSGEQGGVVYDWLKTPWEKDFQLVIDVHGIVKDGNLSPENFIYHAECRRWDTTAGDNKEGWVGGSCDIPDVNHVDKTMFASSGEMRCPQLYLNGVFKDNKRYYLDFSANGGYEPIKPDLGSKLVIPVNGGQSVAANDNTTDEFKQKKEEVTQIAEESQIDRGGGIEKEPATCDMLGDEIRQTLAQAYVAMEILGVALYLGMNIWGFTQAIASSEQDKFKKLGKKMVFRTVALVVLLILPILIKSILGVLKAAGVEAIIDFCIDQFL